MGYIDKSGRYYIGDMLPGDRETTPAEQAAKDAEIAAVLAKIGTDETHISKVKDDKTVAYLRTHTPDECYNKVQADVTDLASAKKMMGSLAMALCVLVRRI